MESCPIWDGNYWAKVIHIPETSMNRVMNSARAGGSYEVWEILVEAEVKHMTDPQRARLTTWLIDQRAQGNEMPSVTREIVAYAKGKRALSAHERASRLIKYMAYCSELVGHAVNISRFVGSPTAPDFHIEALSTMDMGAMAWSESISLREVGFLLSYLVARGWVSDIGQDHYSVTVDGYSEIADLELNTDSSQAFVAMWFDGSMEGAYQDAIEPGIRDAGYNPLRIDRKDHINKIDDELISELRRSRFLVADFTHGPDGARGGVYYEAGFAHGLGLPVIFTCRQDCLGTLHFDTSHYNHLVWGDHAELRTILTNRILAVIGEGPEAHGNP